MSFIFLFLGAAAQSPVTIVSAAPVVEEKPVDAAIAAEAIRLLDAEGFEEEALRSSALGLEASLAAMTEQIHKTVGDSVPADFLEKMRQTMRDHTTATMTAQLPALKRAAAQLYARQFTRDELIRLRAIESDPVMVKARARNRILAPQLMMLGIKAMRDAQPELDAKLKALVEQFITAKKGKANS